MQKITIVDVPRHRTHRPARTLSIPLPFPSQNDLYQQRVRRNVEMGASMSALSLEVRKPYVSRNALRGWIYALLPSAVLWAIMIGIIYSILKR